jgi:hypothetical protein
MFINFIFIFGVIIAIILFLAAWQMIFSSDQKDLEWVAGYLNGSEINTFDYWSGERELVHGKYKGKDVRCGYFQSKRMLSTGYFVAMKLNHKLKKWTLLADLPSPTEGTYIKNEWLYYTDINSDTFSENIFPSVISELYRVAEMVDLEPEKYHLHRNQK